MLKFLRRFSTSKQTSRKFLIPLLALLATSFLCFSAFSGQAHAADATWSQNRIIYQNNAYIGPVADDTLAKLKLDKGASAYTYVSQASTGPTNSTQYMNVIYFDSGVDVATATTAKYVMYRYNSSSSFTDPTPVKSITIDAQTSGSQNGGTNSCAVDGGLGWILCPVTTTIAGAMDWAFDAISAFLYVKPVSTDTNGALYQAWNAMRGIANVAFIIVFMILIYSQLTNLGVSNYGIKKILPRLIIAALLVNLSYYIAAIAVDISNIAGKSVQQIFISIRNSLIGTNTDAWNPLSAASLSGFVLSGGTIVAAGSIAIVSTLATYGVVGSLALLLPALVIGLIGILVALFVLAARQALITILIVIAPIAFVAFLLPNTEKFFDKWSKLFMTLLIMFPAFALVFSGAQLAGSIIIRNADSINLVILGLAVQVIPLAITPLLLRLGGSTLSRITGVLNNPNKGIIDRTRNFTKDRTDAIAARRLGTIAPIGFRGGLQRRAQTVDFKKRTREGWKSAHLGMADARWANSANYRAIDQQNRENADYKKVGETDSELAYNNSRLVNGSRAQQLDRQVRENKDRLANVETATDNSYKGTAAYRQLHQDTYSLNAQKRIIESELERDLQRRVNDNPLLLQQEMMVRIRGDQATAAKAHIDKIAEELKAGFDTSQTQNLGDLMPEALQVHLDVRAANDATNIAKNKQETNYAEAILTNTEQVRGENIVTYAAGVGGEASQKAVASRAVTVQQEEYVKIVNERKNLAKRFKVNYGDRMQLLTNPDVTVIEKEIELPDGRIAVQRFEKDDIFVQEAFLDEMMTIGTLKDRRELIIRSGTQFTNYLDTISGKLPDTGKKALYLGGLTIGKVSNGDIRTEDDIIDCARDFIPGARWNDVAFTEQDAEAIDDYILAIQRGVKYKPTDTQAERNEKDARWQEGILALAATADRVALDPRLKNTGSKETRKRIALMREALASQYPYVPPAPAPRRNP